MRISAYIRILGREGSIRKIDAEAKSLNATITPVKGKRKEEQCWSWQTPRTTMDVDNLDAQVKGMLSENQLLFPVARKYMKNTDIYLEIVTEYAHGECPRGLYLSAETILLLSKLGAALDNDVYAAGQDR